MQCFREDWGNSAVGHCRDTWWQEYLVVGRCRDTLRLGTAGILCGWALQGYLVVGQGTAGILCGWALQEYFAIEHCSQAPGGGRGQHRL